MNTPLPDVGDLLHDAVDHLEPADRIDAIRARTASPTRPARPWLYAGGGVALATAAAVAAFAVLGGSPTSSDARHDHDVTTTPTADTHLVAAYFIGETPRGQRLFREFDQVVGSDPLQGALDRIQQPASDPDYRSGWSRGQLGTATLVGATIEVELTGELPVSAGTSEGLPEQQLVYTLQAAAGRPLPVQLVRDGAPVGDPMTAEPQNDVLSLVSISDPAEGLEVHDRFLARGRANSFEATVPWQIRDEDGAVVRTSSAMASGSMDKLYPWRAQISVRGLPDGTYTFQASTDDPSGGEGGGPDTDTRTIIVR